MSSHEMCWDGTLAQLEPVELPYANYSLAPTGSVQYATVPMPIPAEVYALLTRHDGVANRSGFLAAAFAAYLARISGNYTFDLGFSHPALQQEAAGSEYFFATPIPLHIEFDPSAGLGVALGALQTQLALIRESENYAREAALRYRELSSLREPDAKSLLPVIVEQVECLDEYTPSSGSELTLLLSEDSTGCHWVYDTAILDSDTIASMQRQFATFLQYAVADSSRPVVEIPLLTEAEYRQVVIDWNNTQVDYPLHLCLHQLFEAQVERTPDAVAVSSEGKDLTYRALNQRANQLAHYLQKLGVGPEVLVGVFMERSLEMVISLYGILKAGGAYVPLDPEYPPERVAFMLKDTQVPVLLTQERLVASLPEHGAKVICLDSDWATIAEGSADNPLSGVSAENLAYVIYTSGSTGRPKGAMNTHRGICNRLLWMQDTYRLTRADRVLQKTPFSFDVSVWEFFWPLLVGARLIVARPGGHKDSAYLVKLIVEQEITTLHFVPSMLQVFLEDREVEKCQCLKRVICSGEALPYELQKRFYTRLDAELHNLYGPTEAAVDVTYWACQRESSQRIVPIGRPVANTQIYLLDSRLQPVPVGVPGELHIGGVQVARGYLNRPELTAERFIRDPFSDQPGAQLYKTGDLARYLPDGNIEFLGRMDFQVKIRGFRIELGEIESVLVEHSAVRQAVVLAHDYGSGDRRLVAYLVPDREGAVQLIGGVRKFVQEKLPEYMMPATFILLEELPLTPNGKLDRRALPAPDQSRPNLEQAYVAPRTEMERRLASMWCEVLKLEQVGVHDRFFELGGDSIQAALFVNRLQKELDEFIYIVTIFEAPTIAEYAGFLEQDYAEAVAKWVGTDGRSGSGVADRRAASRSVAKVDASMVAHMRQFIPSLPPLEKGEGTKETRNRPAIFILGPPRSGTTLLRVMLAGHPRLFAASELQLLGFNTLKERSAAFTGKFSAWLEGTIRAIMEIKGCDADEAKRIMQQYEEQDYTTKDFYGVLQDWIGDRILVDKSPSYAFDLETLKKAERDSENALYIHLVRHPYAMVRSFESMHMDQVLFLDDHPFTTQQLAELIWVISHQNILEFLQGVPENRQFHMTFEELTHRPQETMEAMCKALDLEFHPDLLQPYKDREKKMTDGIYPASTPMGDIKFHEHRGINPEVADRWKQVETDNFLGDITWQLARSLGYDVPDGTEESDSGHELSHRRRKARARREFVRRQRERRSRSRATNPEEEVENV
jgi:amino acid adenylation domain-containing protein